MELLKMRRIQLREQETLALLPMLMRYAQKSLAAERNPLTCRRGKPLPLSVCSITVATLVVSGVGYLFHFLDAFHLAFGYRISRRVYIQNLVFALSIMGMS